MNSREISHYKATAFDLVSKVQALRRQRLEIDARVAAAFKEGRANGIDRRAIKECLAELGDQPLDTEKIWNAYAAKIGITDADITDDDANPLDAILGAR